MDIDRSFKSATRHATARTVIICITVLIATYWLVPVIIAAIKR